MRINTGWLRDYLASDCQEQELLDAFMTVGLEVEEEFHLAEALAPIRIGLFARRSRWVIRARCMNARWKSKKAS